MPVSVFQSPLHRGRVFHHSLHLSEYGPLYSFSPLFIGEGSSTMIFYRHQVGHVFFQSPLHRGRVFNKCSYRSPCPPRRLSVPSSSGKGLQRGLEKAALRAQAPFSPLFIGEGSSTRRKPGASPARRSFQSPLHRGRVFNDWRWPPPPAWSRTFSPLFIG